MQRSFALSALCLSLFAFNTSAANISWGDWHGNVSSNDNYSHASASLTNQNMAVVQGNVATVNNDLNATKSEQEKINTSQSQINAQQDKVNADQAVVNTQQTEANDQQKAVNEQQATINNNQFVWNTHQDAANGNFNDDLNRLNGRVDSLRNKVNNLDDRMQKGFANQAALSGLFQPYSVGKFNLSMSLGGYESKNAMAIGSGYRFNENVAVKSGVSTNTNDFKGVAYNAAVNLEW